MGKPLLVVCFVLNLCTVGWAQQANSNNDLSAQQSAEFVLALLPDQIKLIEEPALRVFLRIQIATFLWSGGRKDLTASSLAAERVALEAFTDLKENEQRIPTSYAQVSRQDLMALLKLHRPTLYAKVNKGLEDKETDNRNPIGTAFSMIDSKQGITPAVNIVTKVLRGGHDPGYTFISILHRLQDTHPAEFLQLLKEAVIIQERASNISFDVFSSLLIFFKSEDIPVDLKARFFTLSLKGLEAKQTAGNPGASISEYQFLQALLSSIRSLTPQLLQRAESLANTLRGRFSQALLEQADIERRVQESKDPLTQLIVEANGAREESLKRDLQRRAAQIAFGKGQLKLAADLEITASAADIANGAYRDQFLGEIVTRSIKEKTIDIAEYAASQILFVLTRAAAKQKLALYYYDSGDLIRARETLNEAAKLVASSNNSLEKAKSLLFLMLAFRKVDSIRVVEMAQAAVTAINNTHIPGQKDELGSQGHNEYVWSLAQLGYVVVSAFQRLVEHDELAAYSIAKGIQRQDIRLAALFGAGKGMILLSERMISTENK